MENLTNISLLYLSGCVFSLSIALFALQNFLGTRRNNEQKGISCISFVIFLINIGWVTVLLVYFLRNIY